MSRDEREKYVQKKYGQRICTINIITTQIFESDNSPDFCTSSNKSHTVTLEKNQTIIQTQHPPSIIVFASSFEMKYCRKIKHQI